MLTLPLSRIPEIPYLLKSFTDLDIYEYRTNGRKFFNKYFSSVPNVIDTLLATLRTRFGMMSPEFTNSIASDIHFELPSTMLNELRGFSEENNRTGILNGRKSSVGFKKNFSSVTLERYKFWNSYQLPFNSLPYNAWSPALPSEEKFINFSSPSLPSTEVAFSRSLGGNYPYEQFTIVVLTYKRENILLEFLTKLNGTKFLHKVIVVWNSPHFPTPDLKWPDIGVEIHVIIMRKNSLNNRFIPYDAIETEAVLSLDDDVSLSHVELLFGFRIWRENRDQIVGFPGRYHRWSEKLRTWAYVSGSCELSMILAGAAFFHKMYSYLYTYEMPRVIREHVSAKMNCEDIALNFLVSHVTRKPPIRVMKKSSFGCRNCKSSLHDRGSHYRERRNCLNLFAQIYGYIPLLHTQFWAEGLLPLKIFPQDVYNCSRPRDEIEHVQRATTVKYPV
ncbi:unnamed protein product [Allacma fusca]|uniref:Glycosyl transferase 64 domain-containing protein n=1 Tax=Allacma fusca TaxID=39272 RepID=A0A8J2NZW1_9HEXA|nr:unnamed protein product [Allacma fusca]